MKTLLPLGMVLLVGVAFGLRRSPEPKPAGERQRILGLAIASEKSAVAAIQHPEQATPGAPPPETSTRPAATKVAASTTRQPAWRRMAGWVEREIVLTSFQRESVERILREREAEIQACHQEIRKAGVLDMRRYEWQVAVMKETWYLKLDALMDRAQSDLLKALVQKGFLNEGLGFTVDPGMTVLD